MQKSIFLLFLVFLSLTPFSQKDELEIPCAYKIINVNVIPGNVNTIILNQDVFINCGRIEQITNHIPSNENGSINVDSNPNAPIEIDGTGKFLAPSYSDAHVHMPEEAEMRNFFLMNLMNGVTTLRSMRGEEWHLKIDQADKLCPKLILGSVPLEKSSDYSEEGLKKFIENQKKVGFDFVKLLELDTLLSFASLVEICENVGIPLAGHSPAGVDFKLLCETAIFQSVEHLGGLGAYTSPELFSEAVLASINNGVYHCPTLSWVYALSLSPEQLKKKAGIEFVSAGQIKAWDASLKENNQGPPEQMSLYRKRIAGYFEGQKTLLRQVYLNGGKLLIGPDASDEYMIPGFDYHLEMAQFASVGISNFEILKAACYNLSEMLDETEEWGALRVGASSDLVLLNSNPLEDIKNAQDLAGIMLKGSFYTITELKKME